VESREAWSALQSHLATARIRLEAGDYSAALEAVDAVLAIDPAFLAAHSLRQRIELDRANASTPPEASRPEKVRTPPVTPATITANEAGPAPTSRVPPGRRFGVLLADVYEKRRGDAYEKLQVENAPRIAIPSSPRPLPPVVAKPELEAPVPLPVVEKLEPAPLPPPPVVAELKPAPLPPPVVAELKPAPLPPPVVAEFKPASLRPPVVAKLDTSTVAETPSWRPHEDRDTTEDAFPRFNSIQDPDDIDDLRLNPDDDLDALEREGLTGPWSRTTSRGPRLVFIAAAMLVALIVGERRFRLQLPDSAAFPFPSFTSPTFINPAPEPAPLLTARQLQNSAVELAAVGRSLNTSAFAVGDADREARPADAPTLRSVTVSGPVPASTLIARTTAAADAAPAQPDTAGRTPAPAPATASAPPPAPVPPPASAPLPASATPAASVPAPRTADAEVASFTRPASDASSVTPAVVESSSVVDEQSVKTALQRYRAAYEKLDAKSARTVWPSVNEAALARAFDSLQAQTLTFTTCDVDFRGPAAVATCEGSTKYTPRYGSHEPRVEPRVWTFTLRKLGGDWKIDSVRAGR